VVSGDNRPKALIYCVDIRRSSLVMWCQWESGRQKCEFSLSNAIPSVCSSPVALHIQIYTASRGFPATARLLFYFCLCPSLRQITEKVVNGFWQNFLQGYCMARDQGNTFWWRSGSPSRSRSPKSEIRIHWIIEKYLVDSDQGCIANLHCKNIQQFYYAGVQRRSVLPEYF